MAIDSTSKSIQIASAEKNPSMSLTEIATGILSPLASLKLTVVLLVLAVIVTFIATIDQTRNDILDVKNKHFASVFVEVPFQTLFVPRWFPSMQNVPGSFYIPSGISILTLMLINLTAAHMLRFRLQASGIKLVVGIVAAALAAILTWIIIFNGQNASGFQAAPPISYQRMWILMQIAVLALACASAFGFFTIDRKRRVERYLLLTAALLLGAVLILVMVLGEKAFIGDSAMRILWQLAQATIAACASLVACIILFRRKAGMVLLHLGIAGLMLNEIYVTVTNQETRMTIREGETVSQAVDIRSTEMAIINTSDSEFDDIVVVPGSHLDSGETVKHQDLPFDVTCLQYMRNSDVRRIQNPAGNLADQGIGQQFEAFELPITTGTDAEQTVDFASAYVQLTNKSTGKPIGNYLISQNFDVKNADRVEVDGETYYIDLRFKTDYKPFSMTLKDVRAEYYIGTETPSSYSSDVVLNDLENGTSSEQKIWMNNPLRYADQTFYQSSLGTLPGGIEYTVLQVVRNKGWMIPYVCCMFTVVGLCWQFGSSLLAFLRKKNAENALEAKVPLAELAINEQKRSRVVWVPAATLLAIFGLYVLSQMAKPFKPVVNNEMRLDLLGELPVTMNGRVQPLDSFARNTARQLSKRETIKDGNEESQPAIRWLADTMFQAEGWDEYRAFRIEDLTILSSLDLPAMFRDVERNKNRFRYSFKEMMEAEPTLMELIPNSKEVDPETWSPFQKRLSQVATKLQRVYGVKLTFGRPEFDDDVDLVMQLEKAGSIVSSPLIPLIVPTRDPETPWMSYVAMQNEQWLVDLSKKYEVNSTNQLASKIIDEEILPSIKEAMIRRRIIDRFMMDPEFLEVVKKQYGESEPRELARIMESNWDQFPQQILADLTKVEGPMVDAILARQRQSYEKLMVEQIDKVNSGRFEIQQENSELGKLLQKLKPAYLDNDAETFNSTLVAYHGKIQSDPPEGMSSIKLSSEKFYNGFSPFYIASAIYLIAALVTCLGWLGWPEGWHRASFVLILLALSIHLLGLILRVVISGRPPVTNLYSSVIFVSMAFVVLMLVVEKITKIGVGNCLGGLGAFLALMWAWTMTIVDGDTFTVMVAVLDTQFWLSTHVICISLGYAATFAAGLVSIGFIVASLVTPAFSDKAIRRVLANVIYGIVCFALLASFFGTVLGGLWGDDSWGRFWGWDPKENGALMIVLWNAVVLHARWGGIVREKGVAALAIIGNVITLWSWKGVNAMGVGLHAYADSEDKTISAILMVAGVHILVACLAMIPSRFWMSYALEKK